MEATPSEGKGYAGVEGKGYGVMASKAAKCMPMAKAQRLWQSAKAKTEASFKGSKFKPMPRKMEDGFEARPLR